MADEVLVEQLRLKGASRRGHPDGVDLRGADLRGANLRGMDLSGACLVDADLSKADIRGANFSGADMRSVRLDETRAGSAIFFAADMRDAIICHSDLEVCNFRRANLSDADFIHCAVQGADFTSAKLAATDFNGTVMGSTIGLIDGGQSINGSRFLMVRHEDEPRISAERRWFRIREARTWSFDSDDSDTRVRAMIRIARILNWPGAD